MNNILITGGAGYIGSHVAKQLLQNSNHKVTILDNLSTGNTKTLDTLRSIREFTLVELDLKEFSKVDKLLEVNNFDTIIHFAASIVVPESVSNPLKYYMNNTVNTTNLLKCAVSHGVKKFIFSSTAAVYGEVAQMPTSGVSEDFATNPISPYGMSKLMSESIIKDTANAHSDIKYVIFRYFNVAGADINYEGEELNPRIGQRFPNATHLIKIASETALAKRPQMAIFGNNFNTHDGTGIRDYIHVDDLASAHILAVDYLEDNSSDTFNVGYGRGSSVKEVIDTMKKVSSVDFKVITQDMREGDLAALIADNKKIKSKMNWVPKYESLELICKSAYAFEKKLV